MKHTILALTTLVVAQAHTLTVNCDNSSAQYSTLAQAQHAVRKLQPLTANVTVKVTGTCQSDGHTPLLSFSPTDGGTENFSVSYIGSDGARLTGGHALEANKWKKVAATTTTTYTQSLVGVNLGPLGYGNYGNSGTITHCDHTKLELFFNNTPMVAARYPNVGPADQDPSTYFGPWKKWLFVNDSHKDGSGYYLTTTDLPNDIGQKLKAEVAQKGSNVWVHGFWHFEWMDEYAQLIKLEEDGASGWKLYWKGGIHDRYPRRKSRFYILNAKSLLDSPGEYVIDSHTHTVTFSPPGGSITAAPAMLNIHEGSLVRLETSVSNVEISNFVIDATRGSPGSKASPAIVSSASNTKLSKLIIRNHGHSGIDMNSYNSLFSDSTVQYTGCQATKIAGGDGMKLIRANTEVNNVHISYFGRLSRCYQPGIRFEGCGLTVKNSVIEYGPHSGLHSGEYSVNHQFINNTFSNLVFGTSDSGAFYMGKMWNSPGIVFTGNTFSDIRGQEPYGVGPFGSAVHAVYLDAQMSYVSFYNNTFKNCTQAIKIDGGRGNHVVGNHFQHCGSCVKLYNRGMDPKDREHAWCAPNGTFWKLLERVNYTNPPWSTQFPQVADIKSHHPCWPYNNSFVDNTICPGHKLVDRSTHDIEHWGSHIKNNKHTDKC